MTVRTAQSSHLGERRFHEYPVIAADEWGLQADLARGLLTPARLAGAVLVVIALVAGAFLLLR